MGEKKKECEESKDDGVDKMKKRKKEENVVNMEKKKEINVVDLNKEDSCENAISQVETKTKEDPIEQHNGSSDEASSSDEVIPCINLSEELKEEEEDLNSQIGHQPILKNETPPITPPRETAGRKTETVKET